eukprot:GHVT01101914.1.p1 GENE.GHVT01101914.1~~GHVT01101914.1.p1  ORF type:complete len:304 (+),score=45.04 GHVT01101914.1:2395-3306(+)
MAAQVSGQASSSSFSVSFTSAASAAASAISTRYFVRYFKSECPYLGATFLNASTVELFCLLKLGSRNGFSWKCLCGCVDSCGCSSSSSSLSSSLSELPSPSPLFRPFLVMLPESYLSLPAPISADQHGGLANMQAYQTQQLLPFAVDRTAGRVYSGTALLQLVAKLTSAHTADHPTSAVSRLSPSSGTDSPSSSDSSVGPMSYTEETIADMTRLRIAPIILYLLWVEPIVYNNFTFPVLQKTIKSPIAYWHSWRHRRACAAACQSAGLTTPSMLCAELRRALGILRGVLSSNLFFGGCRLVQG